MFTPGRILVQHVALSNDIDALKIIETKSASSATSVVASNKKAQAKTNECKNKIDFSQFDEKPTKLVSLIQ